MKITLEKNELMEINADIPNDYYNVLKKYNINEKYPFDISQTLEKAVEYVKALLPSFNEKHQDLLLEELRLTRSDVYGETNW